MQTSAPVQLVVVLSLTQTNSGEQSVATPPRQSPAVINPNSLTAVVKELRMRLLLIITLSQQLMKLKLSIREG